MGHALGADAESVVRRCGTDYLPKTTYVISGSRPATGQTTPNFFCCLVQLCGSALVSEVTVRSAGALPLTSASTMRGDEGQWNEPPDVALDLVLDSGDLLELLSCTTAISRDIARKTGVTC